jgi:hypothetical protein
MKKYIINVLAITLLLVLNYSCQDDYVSNLDLDGQVTISKFSVGTTEGIINEKAKTIKVVVPDGTDITKLSPVIVLPEGAVISPVITANMDFSVPVEFTVVNGSIYTKYTISVTEQFYIAFLGTAPNVNGITGDDEKAAADWFFENYDNAEYVSFDAIKNGSVDLTKYRLLWWYFDEGRNLPEIAKDPTVLDAIKTYYKGGRNLLFNSHACAYLWDLGRMENSPYGRVIGDGAGFENGDTWAIGANVGSHNVTTHPIYKGVSFNQDSDGYNWVPVIGPGWREDHNYVLENIAGSLGLGPNNNEAAYEEFTTRHNAEWLGVWAGIRDYWMVGIMELKPTPIYKGKSIFIGIGGFEFNQNDQGTINPTGVNIYQSNINKITKNSIDYLSLKN